MASNNHQQNETPTIASNSSSNTEFYDAESNDESESCCVFKSLAEIEITKITKEGNLKEEYCCAKCGRSVEELIAREKLKQEGKKKKITYYQ